MAQRPQRTAPNRREAREPRQPGRHRRPIFAILLMAAGLLLLLALISYDPADEATASIHASDLFNVFTGDAAARAKADTTRNWLGLVGAVMSDFFVTSTIGYSVLVLPFLMVLWGWTILRQVDLRRVIGVTNVALVGAMLVSAAFGLVRLLLGESGPGMEWSGLIGDFVATRLSQLIGKTGATVVIAVAAIVTIVLAADLDVRVTAERLRTGWLGLLDWLDRRREEWAERRGQREAERAVQADAGRADPDPGRVNGAGEMRRVAPRQEVRITRPDQDERPEPEEVRPAQRRAEGPERSGPQVRVERKTPARPAEAEASTPMAPASASVEDIDYVFPSVELLSAPAASREEVDEDELKANADLLRATLAEFNVELESVSVTPGPVVTLYELVPASGVKISSIVSLENDMALKLAARGIRIMAPIPGKSAVGVEIPNSHRSLVSMRSVVNSNVFRASTAQLPLAMGKTIAGEVFADDLTKMPHLLMAGSTGSGKSVGINTILASLFFRMHPADLKLVIVDPKKIELAQYAKLKQHFLAISPDLNEEIITTPQGAVTALRGVELEMERRYDRLAAAGVRNIQDYNERLRSGRLSSTPEQPHTRLPYLVVVIDELADLMITAAREVEEPIARLAQLARAVGIHLIVATQRPSVDVITGVIKANFPARVAYQVASKTDSRTILDMNGAEQLLGNGDMLYLASGSPKPVRLQNAYISPDEVDAIVDHIARQQGYAMPFLLPSLAERKRAGAGGGREERDELFEEAARLIVRHQQGSVSLLQRRLKVGYSRAARLVDELEMAGIVGPFDGSKAREVLVQTEEELEVILNP
jgi:S-DNA-T family DNA segregation ATPase FtsK/SpoIIIE